MTSLKITNSEKVFIQSSRKNAEVLIQRFCKNIDEAKLFLGDVQKDLGTNKKIQFYDKGIHSEEGTFDVLLFYPDNWTTYASYFPHQLNNKSAF